MTSVLSAAGSRRLLCGGRARVRLCLATSSQLLLVPEPVEDEGGADGVERGVEEILHRLRPRASPPDRLGDRPETVGDEADGPHQLGRTAGLAGIQREDYRRQI